MTKKSMILLMFCVAVNGMNLDKFLETKASVNNRNRYDSRDEIVSMNNGNDRDLQSQSNSMFGPPKNANAIVPVNNENGNRNEIVPLCNRNNTQMINDPDYEILEESVIDNRTVRRKLRNKLTGEVHTQEQEFGRSCVNDYSNRTKTITYKISQPFKCIQNAIVSSLATEKVNKCMHGFHGACKYPEKDDGEKGYKLIKLESYCKQHKGYLHLCCFFDYDRINHFGVCHAQKGVWSAVKESFKSQAFLHSDCKKANQYADLTCSNRFWVHVYNRKKIIYFVATVFLIGLYTFNMWAHSSGSGWLTPADYNNWTPFTERKWTVIVDAIASIMMFLSLSHMFMNGMIVNFMNIINEDVMNLAGYATVLVTLANFIPGQVGSIMQAIFSICFVIYAKYKGVTLVKVAVQFMYFAWIISILMTSFPTLGAAFKDQQSGENGYNIISKVITPRNLRNPYME